LCNFARGAASLTGIGIFPFCAKLAKLDRRLARRCARQAVQGGNLEGDE